MKLSEFFGDKELTELSISSVERTVSEKNENIFILHLEKAIPTVTGSQTVEAGDESERVSAVDVEQVKIHQNDMAAADEGMDLDENGSGSYKGNLRLDVAKSTGEVWLRTESFLASGRKKRTENREQNNKDVLERLRNRNKQGAKPTVTAETE